MRRCVECRDSGAASSFRGADARQHRRRLRRYRHQPALRVPRGGDGGAAQRAPVSRDVVLGVLSLILWALIIVVTLQIRAVPAARRQQRRGRHAVADGAGEPGARPAHRLVLMLGVIGASMFLGDSVITPAISVLSAVEGLKLATPGLRALRRRR